MHSFYRKTAYFPFDLTKISEKWAENEKNATKRALFFLQSCHLLLLFPSVLYAHSGTLYIPDLYYLKVVHGIVIYISENDV